MWDEIKHEIFTDLDLKGNNESYDHQWNNQDVVDDPLPWSGSRNDLEPEPVDENEDPHPLWNPYKWVEMTENDDAWTCKVCARFGRTKPTPIENSLMDIVRAWKEHELSEEHVTATLKRRGVYADENVTLNEKVKNGSDGDDSDASWSPENIDSPPEKRKIKKKRWVKVGTLITPMIKSLQWDQSCMLLKSHLMVVTHFLCQ